MNTYLVNCTVGNIVNCMYSRQGHREFHVQKARP
jgi:hypothetical protein